MITSMRVGNSALGDVDPFSKGKMLKCRCGGIGKCLPPISVMILKVTLLNIGIS